MRKDFGFPLRKDVKKKYLALKILAIKQPRVLNTLKISTIILGGTREEKDFTPFGYYIKYRQGNVFVPESGETVKCTPLNSLLIEKNKG